MDYSDCDISFYYEHSWTLKDELHHSKFEISVLLNGCIVRLVSYHLIPANYILDCMTHQLGLLIYRNPQSYYVSFVL